MDNGGDDFLRGKHLGYNPYDSQSPIRRPLQEELTTQMQAALEMGEALYLHRQCEIQRDLQREHIRRLLLQEQLDQQHLQQLHQRQQAQNRAAAAEYATPKLTAQQLYELQFGAGAGAGAASLLAQEERLLLQAQQEQAIRHQLQQQQQQLHSQMGAYASAPNPQQRTNLQTAADALSQYTLSTAAKEQTTRKRPASSSNKKAPVPAETKKENEETFPAEPVVEASPLEKTSAPEPEELGESAKSGAEVLASFGKHLKGELIEKPGKVKNKRKLPSDEHDIPDEVNDDPKKLGALLMTLSKRKIPEASFFQEEEEYLPPVPMEGVEKTDNGTETPDLETEELAALIVNIHAAPTEWSEDETSERVPQKARRVLVRGFASSIPTLPIEPEYVEPPKEEEKEESDEENQTEGSTKEADHDARASPKSQDSKASGHGSQLDTKEPYFGAKKPFDYYSLPVDTWWPSNNTIKREKKLRGEKSDDEEDSSVVLPPDSLFMGPSSSVKRRLEKDIEPGVLEKLPHCKIHRIHSKQKEERGHVAGVPLFCWQVTENYCNDIMVCCSNCSTWRHAACGGHYKPYSIRENIRSEEPFVAVCDRCHEENAVLEKYPKARARIERQRVESLRRTLATTAVSRQFAFSKHGGTYKWPLGSVSATHIGGHTRSVHARHERAEKQWGEMAIKLSSGLGYRPKERVKVRTRELERLLVSVEDSESAVDRHNIKNFLERDTKRECPVGFEKTHSSMFFFDPEDEDNVAADENHADEEKTQSQSEDSDAGKEMSSPVLGNTNDTLDDDGDVTMKDGSRSHVGRVGRKRSLGVGLLSRKHPLHGNNPDANHQSIEHNHNDSENDNENGSGTPTARAGTFMSESTRPVCSRKGCKNKPRFDSIFCSDACGVAAVEMDILRSMEYVDDIHPSLLRA